MKIKLILVLFFFVILCTAVQTRATVLTFDDLSGTGNPVPNGYGGLNWVNMRYLNAATYGTYSGYTNGVVSLNNVTYNAYGNPAAASDGLFDFNGCYLTGAWNNGLNIDVLGYSGGINGSLLYARTVVVDTYAPTWFQFDYDNIDYLKFVSYGGTPAGYSGEGVHFAMDNFTLNESMHPQVPEPATMGLLASLATGLFGFAGLRKRFTK